MKISVNLVAVASHAPTLLTESKPINTSSYLKLKKPMTAADFFKTHTYEQMQAAEEFIGNWLDDQTDAGRDKAAVEKMKKNALYMRLGHTFDNLEGAMKEARKIQKLTKRNTNKGTGKSSKVPEFLLDPAEQKYFDAAKKKIEKALGHSHWDYDPDLVDGGTSTARYFISGDESDMEKLKAALVKGGFRPTKRNTDAYREYKKFKVSVMIENNQQITLSAPLITNPQWKSAPRKRNAPLYD